MLTAFHQAPERMPLRGLFSLYEALWDARCGMCVTTLTAPQGFNRASKFSCSSVHTPDCTRPAALSRFNSALFPPFARLPTGAPELAALKHPAR
ncbi:MAG: hypothetical protein WED11_02530 [Natronospirillum sp.]